MVPVRIAVVQTRWVASPRDQRYHRPMPVATSRRSRIGPPGSRLVAMLLAGLLFSLALPGPGQTQRSATCGRMGTLQEAQELAEQAADHLGAVGAERAFRDFLNPGAGFMRHDLYVFVLDGAGLLWVNGGFPELIGSNILDARDTKGRPFLAEAMAQARRDGAGWVEYEWYNPCSGKFMAKSSYVIAKDGFFVGVGAYGSVGV